MLGSVEKFRWGRGESKLPAALMLSSRQGISQLKRKKVFSSLVWALLPIFPLPTSPGSAGSFALPGASMDATVSSLLLLQPSAPLQRGLVAKHPLVLVLGNIPFSANMLLTLVFAPRRRNYQFPRPGGGSRAAWGTCVGCGAGTVEAQESQNWAFPVRQGFLLELDQSRQNICQEAHPIACHAGLGLDGWG